MSRVQLFALLGAFVYLFLILELVRRRALSERYALLWLWTGFVLLAFGLWRNLVDLVGETLGIYYTPAALILVFTFFVMVMLLHFSTVISRLVRQNDILAQRLALLQWQVGGDNANRLPPEGQSPGKGSATENVDERLPA